MWAEANIWRCLSAAGDGCYVVNDRCQIVLWNEAAQKLLGFSSQEVLQRYCYEVVRGRGEDDHLLCQPECTMRQAASKGASLPGYYLLAHRKDDESCWLSVSLLLISLPPSGAQYIVHLLRDASQEKRALALTEQVLSFIESHTGAGLNLWDPPPSIPQSLSKRETEILRLLAGGADLKTIAGHLSISPNTVRNHLQSASGKLGLHSRLDLLIYVFKNHLI